MSIFLECRTKEQKKINQCSNKIKQRCSKIIKIQNKNIMIIIEYEYNTTRRRSTCLS